LQEQPAHYCVGQAHADNVASFEFGEKAHSCDRLPEQSREYTGKIEHLVHITTHPTRANKEKGRRKGTARLINLADVSYSIAPLAMLLS
jgi:hypothetical protein